MNELYQVATRYSQPHKNWCKHLLFPIITLTRARCVKSQLHRLMSHVPIEGPSIKTRHPQSPILDVASSNPSCVTYPTGRLRTWPSSVLFRSWRMLECKFTTQNQRCPWVSASSNIHLGSSIWAAIISVRSCFVYFGSWMETSTFHQEAKALHWRGGVMLC